MKLIIGVYDREVSHNLAVILSSKKIIPIEAEASEEIPSLLEIHRGAMLLCEETSIDFYQNLYDKNLLTDTFLLYHPNLSTTDLLKLRKFGLKSLIPYTEDANTIIDLIAKQLSLLASSLKKNDASIMTPNINIVDQKIKTNNIGSKNPNNVAIHLVNSKRWTYGKLLGLNSSKVSVSIHNKDVIQDLLQDKASDNILMYLQGLNIRVFADLVNINDNNFVFRYRQMSKDDAQRLAYFINHCQKNPKTETLTMNI